MAVMFAGQCGNGGAAMKAGTHASQKGGGGGKAATATATTEKRESFEETEARIRNESLKILSGFKTLPTEDKKAFGGASILKSRIAIVGRSAAKKGYTLTGNRKGYTLTGNGQKLNLERLRQVDDFLFSNTRI